VTNPRIAIFAAAVAIRNRLRVLMTSPEWLNSPRDEHDALCRAFMVAAHRVIELGGPL
jgi:hypothetical protein